MSGEATYEELYVEHAPAARGLALSMVPPDAADDVVAEAFARVLAAIRSGGGPDHAFRGYLLATVRNLANDWIAARRRVTVIGDIGKESARSASMAPGYGGGAETEAEARAEARLIARAFSRLPDRWRTVLWQLEVEGKAPAEVAPMFGLSGNGVSALAMRAREGLRQAYLQEHIGTNIPASCRACATVLGAGARGRLSPRRRAAMREHLAHCPACQDLFTELSELNRKLGTILAPIALAGPSAALHAGRPALLRAGLSAHWRAMRWHPVTAAAGAAASVAVAGGMLFAVNVTPLPGAPSHVAVRPAGPAANPGPAAGHHPDGRRGGGGGGGGGTGSAGGTLSGSGAPADGAPPGAAGPLAGPAPMTGTGPLAGADSLASTAGSAVSELANTAGTTVTRLAGTAGATVTGVAGTAGATVSGVAGAVGGIVADTASTATAAVNGVTGQAASAVTHVASTASTAVSGTANTVAGTANTAAGTADTAAAASTTASAGGPVTATVTGVVGAALG